MTTPTVLKETVKVVSNKRNRENKSRPIVTMPHSFVPFSYFCFCFVFFFCYCHLYKKVDSNINPAVVQDDVLNVFG